MGSASILAPQRHETHARRLGRPLRRAGCAGSEASWRQVCKRPVRRPFHGDARPRQLAAPQGSARRAGAGAWPQGERAGLLQAGRYPGGEPAVQVIVRIAQLALALCALMPLIAAAHGNHKQPLEAAALAAGAIAAAPSHCPDDGGPGCGGHGSSCIRAGEPDMIDAAPAACALQQSSVPSLLSLTGAVPPRSTPLLTFPPRAPPVSS